MRPKFRINDKVKYKGKEYTIIGVLKGTIENRHTENEVVHHEINFYNTGFREYYDSFHVPDYVPEDESEFYQYDIGIRDTLTDGTSYIKTVAENNLVKEN